MYLGSASMSAPDKYGATEEKSARELGLTKKMTALQKTFIKTSIDMRKRGKVQASLVEPKDNLVEESMENEVIVLKEDEYEEMLQDIEHPVT